MSNPYYRVKVSARVRLHPRGMNNNILENIKTEAEKEYNNKCYKDYGYIDGIYKIMEDSRGVIQSEDSTASGTYNVEMDCRMLVPIPGEHIYVRITGINDKIICAETGQLKVMISEKSINNNNIRYIKNAFHSVDSDGKPVGEPIVVGTFVVVKLIACKIVPTKTHIIGLGRLESVVKEEDYDKVHTNKEEKQISIDELENLRGRNNIEKEIKIDSGVKNKEHTESESESDSGSEIESTEETED